jgi:Response regulator containing a CheY-like receiver domain and an HTH DNA-binding domain
MVLTANFSLPPIPIPHMSIRLLVIEPLEIVRMGLRALFDSAEYLSLGFSVVAGIDSPDNLVPLYSAYKPDIILTEAQFPKTTAFEAIEILKHTFPESKVLVYTMSKNPMFVAQSAMLGVDEYIEKTSSVAELIAALVDLHAGKERPIDHRLNRMVSQMKSKRKPAGYEIPLTGRELQVLRHIAFGMSNKEIARSLEISIDTVKEHVQNILRKMGLRDRTHAAVWAVRRNII